MQLRAKNAIRAAALCLAAILPAVTLVAQGKPRIAIFEPEEEVLKGEKPQLTAMTKSIIWGALEEGLLSTAAGRYTFLDRSRVRQAAAELTATRNPDIYSSEGRKEFQSRLAADMICLTNVVKEKKGISLRVSIMNVETGEIEHSASDYRATKKDLEIAQMVRALAARIIPRGATFATAQQPVPLAKPVEAPAVAPPPAPMAKPTVAPPPAPPPLQMPTTAKTLDQAIAGVTKYWEQYGRLDSSDKFDLYGPVYRIKNRPNSRYFWVTKNDSDFKYCELDGIMNGVTGLSIFVTEKEDVYVAGYVDAGINSRGIVWKNGRAIAYGEKEDISKARFEYIWVWERGNNDVFVAGSNFPSAERRERGGGSDGGNVKALMLNGKIIREK